MSRLSDSAVFYDPSKPALAALVPALVGFAHPDVSVKVLKKSGCGDAHVKLMKSQEAIHGEWLVARFMARLCDQQAGLGLYGSDAFFATQVERIVGLAEHDLCRLDTIEQHVAELNEHLSLCTFFVEDRITLADMAVWAALKRNQRWNSFTRRANEFPNVIRWFNFVETLPEFAEPLKVWQESLKSSCSSSGGGGGKKASKASEAKKPRAKGEADSRTESRMKLILPGAEKGKVCTRFPPEPSGYMHIGHAKASLLNDYFARQYDGQLILRFDDTNPTNEKQEFVDNIFKDLETLGVKYDKLTHTSDSFELILEMGERMLKEGKAYIDDTPVEQMREEKGEGIESRNRNNSVEKNLEMWEQMKAGTEQGQKCCMRAKIDMSSNNGTMRDPVMYRVNLAHHHRTGDKYKVYPTYDFACPIVDSIEGVTHSLRTNEYHDRNEQFYWFIDAMGLRKPMIWDFGRLNFTYTVLSKRKLKWFVEEGLVDGWNDPRFPTVQGILRRGVTVDALREFIYHTGATQTVNNFEWDKFWTINKRIIDPIAHRFNAVSAENPATLVISNAGEAGVAETDLRDIPVHPKSPEMGTKQTPYAQQVLIEFDDAEMMQSGEEITLMAWGNMRLGDVERTGDGSSFAPVPCTFVPNGNTKKTKKVHWVAQVDDLVHITLVEYTYLVKVPKIEPEMKFEDVVTPKTKFETPLLGEPALAALKEGDFIQLQRRGFCRCDHAYGGPEDPLVLILIPSGKTKAMSTIRSKCIPSYEQ